MITHASDRLGTKSIIITRASDRLGTKNILNTRASDRLELDRACGLGELGELYGFNAVDGCVGGVGEWVREWVTG